MNSMLIPGTGNVILETASVRAEGQAAASIKSCTRSNSALPMPWVKQLSRRSAAAVWAAAAVIEIAPSILPTWLAEHYDCTGAGLHYARGARHFAAARIATGSEPASAAVSSPVDRGFGE